MKNTQDDKIIKSPLTLTINAEFESELLPYMRTFNYLDALSGFSDFIRNLRKYGYSSEISTAELMLEHITQRFYEILDDEDIDLLER